MEEDTFLKSTKERLEGQKEQKAEYLSRRTSYLVQEMKTFIEFYEEKEKIDLDLARLEHHSEELKELRESAEKKQCKRCDCE